MKEYLKSIVEVSQIFIDAGKMLVADTVERVDTWLADYGDADGPR